MGKRPPRFRFRIIIQWKVVITLILYIYYITVRKDYDIEKRDRVWNRVDLTTCSEAIICRRRGEDRVLESVESVLDFSKVHYDNERLQYHSKYREKTITPRWRNILISVAYLDEGHQGSEAPKIIKVGGHGTFIITLITFYLNNIIYVENNILIYKKLYKNRKKIRIHVSYINGFIVAYDLVLSVLKWCRKVRCENSPNRVPI